ncbi:unnamed protein product, partial [Prorocentrum cordatum]
ASETRPPLPESQAPLLAEAPPRPPPQVSRRAAPAHPKTSDRALNAAAAASAAPGSVSTQNKTILPMRAQPRSWRRARLGPTGGCGRGAPGAQGIRGRRAAAACWGARLDARPGTTGSAAPLCGPAHRIASAVHLRGRGHAAQGADENVRGRHRQPQAARQKHGRHGAQLAREGRRDVQRDDAGADRPHDPLAVHDDAQRDAAAHRQGRPGDAATCGLAAIGSEHRDQRAGSIGHVIRAVGDGHEACQDEQRRHEGHLLVSHPCRQSCRARGARKMGCCRGVPRAHRRQGAGCLAENGGAVRAAAIVRAHRAATRGLPGQPEVCRLCLRCDSADQTTLSEDQRSSPRPRRRAAAGSRPSLHALARVTPTTASSASGAARLALSALGHRECSASPPSAARSSVTRRHATIPTARAPTRASLTTAQCTEAPRIAPSRGDTIQEAAMRSSSCHFTAAESPQLAARPTPAIAATTLWVDEAGTPQTEASDKKTAAPASAATFASASRSARPAATPPAPQRSPGRSSTSASSTLAAKVFCTWPLRAAAPTNSHRAAICAPLRAERAPAPKAAPSALAASLAPMAQPKPTARGTLRMITSSSKAISSEGRAGSCWRGRARRGSVRNTPRLPRVSAHICASLRLGTR